MMPKSLRFELSEEQRGELIAMRDHAEKPCLRERSAIVLKIADGMSATQVACSGLYQSRELDTVLHWYWRYRQEGLTGLLTRKGRGRKPAFSPCPCSGRRGQRGTAASGASRSACPGF